MCVYELGGNVQVWVRVENRSQWWLSCGLFLDRAWTSLTMLDWLTIES